MSTRIAPSAALEVAIDELLAEGLGDGERLAEIGRLGARLVLQRAVEEEVTAFLGRARYERTPEARGSRNGNRPRQVQTAEGELEIQVPQVRDAAERFVSSVTPNGRAALSSGGTPRCWPGPASMPVCRLPAGPGRLPQDPDLPTQKPEEPKYMTTMSQNKGVPTIRFDATLYTIDEWTILRLPEKASEKLPSRGQVAVQGTINGHGFQAVLEPDGYFGHWMRIDEKQQQTAAISAGDTATLEIEPLKDWPEPNVPQDFETALAAAPQKIQDLWKDITPMARWEWVRWVNATKNSDTRKGRVEVSISKMKSGKRRPCCFNLAACTDPNLSKSGRLIEPA